LISRSRGVEAPQAAGATGPFLQRLAAEGEGLGGGPAINQNHLAAMPWGDWLLERWADGISKTLRRRTDRGARNPADSTGPPLSLGNPPDRSAAVAMAGIGCR